MHPSQRIPRHEPQQERLPRNPIRQPSEPCDLPQGFGPLFQFEVTEIFQNDRRHRHAQGGGEILDCHCFLLLCIRQEADQALSQVLHASGLVKLNREFLAVSHLTKVGKIRAHDWDSVCACQMCNPAATRR